MASSKTSSQGFYGWTNIAMLALLGVMGGLYIVSFSLFLPFLVEEFAWNRGTVSLAATLNLIVMGLCSPFVGVFIAKYGARRSIVIGNILGCMGFFLLSFHLHLWQLFLCWGIFVGLGAGMAGLLASTTIVNNWFVKKRSLALSIFFGAGGVGGIVMNPALMALIENLGWRSTYQIMACLTLVVAVVLPAFILRNKPEDLGQVPDGLETPKPAAKKQTPRKEIYKTPVNFKASEAIRTRSFWLLTIYFTLTMLATGAVMTHIVAYFFDIGISSTIAATALSVMAGFMTFSQFGVGFVGLRCSMLSIIIVAEILKVISMILLVLTQSLPFVFIYMTIMGIGSGASMVAIMNIYPNYYGAAHYPKIMGFVRLFWTIIGSAGAPLAGYVRESTGSYIPAYQAAIVVFFVGILCLAFAKPPLHPSLKESPSAEVLAKASHELH